MAVKKGTPRRRSATKRAKTAPTATKRTRKPKSAPEVAAPEQSAPAEQPATLSVTRIAAPAAPRIADEDRPSRYTRDYYMIVDGKNPPEGMQRPGKWLVFVSRSRIDALWASVKRAVQGGRLGHMAAVTTALPHPKATDPKKHVLFVYTPDADDPADVRRVRETLRQLGVSWKIPYKAGGPLGGGQHDVMAGGPAAKYYE